MPSQVAVRVFDEMPGGGRREACTLTLVSERVSVRELIERRVRQEVDEYNQQPAGYFCGLVQPTDAEQTLNGWRVKAARRIDADEQVAGALAAFGQGRILLFVGDRQLDALDDQIALRSDRDVCFYKLVPLVGG
jgi:hypothetical protein